MKQEDEKILRRWKTKHQIGEKTYKTYTSIMQHYIRCTQMTISELYTEAITEEENHVPRYRKNINNHILDYYNYLEQSNFSESTKNQHIYVIKSFYKFMDIDLPEIVNNYDPQPDPRNVEKIITKPLIQMMIQTATTRDKAITSFATMTGQSPDEISNITIKQLMDCYNTELENKLFTIEDIFNNRNEILQLPAPRLNMKRKKTGNRYWVYLPSETSHYIIDYLYERLNGTNNKLIPNDKHDYLFVNKKGQQFSGEALGKVFISLGQRCGFEEPELFEDDIRLLLEREEGTHRIWKAYNFRKYFINTCRRYAGTRLDSKTEFVFSGRELADFWVGHTPTGSIKHYLQYNELDVDEMQQQYYQVLPYLSVETEVKTITTEDKQEFEEMKQNYQQVLEEMERMKEYIHSREVVDNWEKEQ